MTHKRTLKKLSKAAELLYQILLAIAAVSTVVAVLASALIILKNKPTPDRIFDVVVWVLWFLSFVGIPLTFCILHRHIRDRNKKLHKSLLKKDAQLPWDSFPLMLFMYNKIKLFHYLVFSDTHDDKKGLYYKNLLRLSVASFMLLFMLSLLPAT